MAGDDADIARGVMLALVFAAAFWLAIAGMALLVRKVISS